MSLSNIVKYLRLQQNHLEALRSRSAYNQDNLKVRNKLNEDNLSSFIALGSTLSVER